MTQSALIPHRRNAVALRHADDLQCASRSKRLNAARSASPRVRWSARFPDLLPMVGYACTATIRAISASSLAADLRAQRAAYYEYAGSGHGPASARHSGFDGASIGFARVLGRGQQRGPQGAGLPRVITDGSIRDIPQWAPGFQALAGSIGLFACPCPLPASGANRCVADDGTPDDLDPCRPARCRGHSAGIAAKVRCRRTVRPA